MKISFYGKSVKFTDAMKEAVEKELGGIEKFLDPNEKAKVTVNEDGDKIVISAQVVTDDNKRIRSSTITQSQGFYAAVKNLVGTLETQILKSKKKYKKKMVDDSADKLNSIDFDHYYEGPLDYALTKRKQIVIEPMSWEKAAREMLSLGHSFYAFKDIDNGNCVSIVYNRFDGSTGLITLK